MITGGGDGDFVCCGLPDGLEPPGELITPLPPPEELLGGLWGGLLVGPVGVPDGVVGPLEGVVIGVVIVFGGFATVGVWLLPEVAIRTTNVARPASATAPPIPIANRP
jgi:hypothetical protein